MDGATGQMQVIDAELGGAHAVGIGASQGVGERLPGSPVAGTSLAERGAGQYACRQVSAGFRAADLNRTSRTAVRL